MLNRRRSLSGYSGFGRQFGLAIIGGLHSVMDSHTVKDRVRVDESIPEVDTTGYIPVDPLMLFVQKFYPSIEIYLSHNDASSIPAVTDVEHYLKERDTLQRTQRHDLQNIRSFHLSEIYSNHSAIQTALISGSATSTQRKWLSCFVRSVKNIDRRMSSATRSALQRPPVISTLAKTDNRLVELLEWYINYKSRWPPQKQSDRLTLLQNLWKHYSQMENRYPTIDDSIRIMDEYHTHLQRMDDERKTFPAGRFLTPLPRRPRQVEFSDSDSDGPIRPKEFNLGVIDDDIGTITRVTPNKLRTRGHLEAFSGNQLRDQKNATQFMIEFDGLANHWLEDTSYQSLLTAFSLYVTEEPARSKFKAYCNQCSSWGEFKELFVKSLPPHLSE
eukprot:gene39668-52322_t